MGGLGGKTHFLSLNYFEESNVSFNWFIDVRMADESLWLTQAQMAELFQTTPQNIKLRIKNIYPEDELSQEATCKEYLQVQTL